jgi:hypothetical protein
MSVINSSVESKSKWGTYIKYFDVNNKVIAVSFTNQFDSTIDLDISNFSSIDHRTFVEIEELQSIIGKQSKEIEDLKKTVAEHTELIGKLVQLAKLNDEISEEEEKQKSKGENQVIGPKKTIDKKKPEKKEKKKKMSLFINSECDHYQCEGSNICIKRHPYDD